jgi:hypothetical protein
LFVHVDSIFVNLAIGFMVVSFGFAMFSRSCACTHFDVGSSGSTISIIYVHTNFVDVLLRSGDVIAPDFKSGYELKPERHYI